MNFVTVALLLMSKLKLAVLYAIIYFLYMSGQTNLGHAADLSLQVLDETKMSNVDWIGDPLFDKHVPKSGKNPRIDVSGIKCFSSTHCVVVADESIAIQQIILDRNGGSVSARSGVDYVRDGDTLVDLCKQDAACPETDLEAVAASGNTLYVTGSWGVKRKSAKRLRDAWTLWRFTISNEGQPVQGSFERVNPDRLRRIVMASEVLSSYVDLPLQCHGMNIEGLAARHGELIFGLRSPARRSQGQIILFRMAIDDVFNDAVPATDVDLKIDEIELRWNGDLIRNVGIRGLETLEDRLLIVTGDSGVGDLKKKHRHKRGDYDCGDPSVKGSHPNKPRGRDAPYHIWSWTPDEGPAILIREIPKVEERKLEGLAVLPSNNADGDRHDLLLTFDGKRARNGAMKIIRGVNLKP